MLKGGRVAVGGQRRGLRCMTGGGAGSELGIVGAHAIAPA